MRRYQKEESKNYRCTKCDCCFTEEEITSMDENENDL